MPYKGPFAPRGVRPHPDGPIARNKAGSIPKELGGLTALLTLDLSSNELEGEGPAGTPGVYALPVVVRSFVPR